LRTFRGQFMLENLHRTFRQIEADLAETVLQHIALDWNEALREAERIADAHLIHVGARSGDLLHVASAVVLGASEFCTFDQRQTELAKRVGLKVKIWR
jgi:predicted nucleic acid-binding protein